MRRIAVVLLALAAFAQRDLQPALEGLDPVLLIDGKEEPGKPGITAKQGRFLYQFASEESRARFQKDPEKYSIQLGGACARMGPPTGGNKDAYHVYKGRIYIFGSQDCYKRFVAEPGKYLESEQPKIAWAPAPQSRAAAGKLWAKMVATISGDRLAALKGWVETRLVTNGTRETTVVQTVLLPGTYRTETIFGENSFGEQVTPDGRAISLFRKESAAAPPEFAAAMRDRARRNLLSLVAAKPDVYLDSQERVAVKAGALVAWMKIDSASGQVRAIGWHGRGPGGEFGEISFNFSDYRPVDGWSLPYKGEGMFNGAADPRSSWTVRSWEINPADLAARFK